MIGSHRRSQVTPVSVSQTSARKIRSRSNSSRSPSRGVMASFRSLQTGRRSSSPHRTHPTDRPIRRSCPYESAVGLHVGKPDGSGLGHRRCIRTCPSAEKRTPDSRGTCGAERLPDRYEPGRETAHKPGIRGPRRHQAGRRDAPRGGPVPYDADPNGAQHNPGSGPIPRRPGSSARRRSASVRVCGSGRQETKRPVPSGACLGSS